MGSTLQKIHTAIVSTQGTVARLTNYLPAPLQFKVARLLGYRHDYPELEPHLRLLLAVRNMQGRGSLLTRDIKKSRQQLRREMAAIAGKPVTVGLVKDFEIDGPASKIKVRHYQPHAAKSDLPLLVFYHGGGFTVGDLETHDEACRVLCHYGQLQVLAVDYRLAPEHPAPAAVDDALAALQWAKTHAAELGADPAKIAVGGDSAGGNLAAVVSQQTKGNAYAPAAQLLIYPAVDLVNEYESRTAFSQGLFLSELEVQEALALYIENSALTLQHPLITPALGDMTNLPPALVITAACDVLRDEGEAYAKRMQELGNTAIVERVAGQGHGFINITPINRAAKKATIKMAQDFRQLLDSLPTKH